MNNKNNTMNNKNNTINKKKRIEYAHELLCFDKDKDKFNLNDFSDNIESIYTSDSDFYKFKIGVTYYVSITDINSIFIGKPVQIPFCLDKLTFTNNKLIIDLYNTILIRINKYDWEYSKNRYNNRLLNSLFDDRSVYSKLICISFDSYIFKN